MGKIAPRPDHNNQERRLQVVSGDQAAATAPQEKKRPRILTTKQTIREVVDQAVAALASYPGTYQRGGMLARVIVTERRTEQGGIGREPGTPQIATLPLPTLREWLSDAADWYRVIETQEGEVQRAVHPPAWAVTAVASRGRWTGAPILEAVAETPMLRPDGTILQEEGYDSATGVLYLPRMRYLPVPEHPSSSQLGAALNLLRDVIADFPCSGDVHRAAWLAGVLTSFARFAYEGPSPLFLVDANTRGSGKGLMVDTAAIIATGRKAARTSQAPDEAEERKRITSIALTGDPIVLIDNITRPFGDGALDAALTATEWRERILGCQDMPTLPLYAIFWATGNNITFRHGADTARRCLHIRLESPLEKPETRQGFRHPSLIRYVTEKRRLLVGAALTLLRGYCAAGRPDQKLRAWGSYEGWSKLVRGCLVWQGQPDPYVAHETLVDMADQTAANLDALLTEWEGFCTATSRVGATARDVLDALAEDQALIEEKQKPRYEGLYLAVAEITGSRPGHLPDPRKLGHALTQLRGRVSAARHLVPLPQRTSTGQAWAVKKVGQ